MLTSLKSRNKTIKFAKQGLYVGFSLTYYSGAEGLGIGQLKMKLAKDEGLHTRVTRMSEDYGEL
jgi:hypothetical protein